MAELRRYLMIVHGALLALFATMALVLAVVWLLYAVNVDEAPRIASQLPKLGGLALGFTVLAVSGGLSFFGQLRGWRLRWLALAAFLLVLLPGLLLISRLVA